MGASSEGKVCVVTGGTRTIVVLVGEIDIAMAAELDQAVQTAEVAGAQVQVDACGLTFLDSAGLTALARLAIRTPGPLIVFGAPDTLRFLLQVTDLHHLVQLRSDETPAGLR